jgi:proteasome lid subunit RPN8/RPN11
MPRELAEIYPRWGRQLLVQGVDFEGQLRLHDWAAVLAGDRSELAQEMARATGRYLVGAGLGRAVAPSAWAAELQALDHGVQLLDGPGSARPPVAHYYFAQRTYGASVDVAVTDADAGWDRGVSGPARVATLRWNLGRPAQPEDSVAIGAAAADLLLADVLGLEPLPAIVVVDWTHPDGPQLTRQPRKADVLPAEGKAPEPGLLGELHGLPEQLAIITTEAELRYPNEACGLLLRTPDGQLKALAAPNLQDRYHALDPVEFPRTGRIAYKLNERLIAKAAEQGEQLVGIWHSHCDAGAYFSVEDVRCAAPGGQALYPDVAYLVVSVLGGQVRATEMYHFDPQTGGFEPEPHA